jgi:serine O-acetyltransferase
VKLTELLYLIYWDCRINRGWSWDSIRAKLMLVEVRVEQYLYRRLGHGPTIIIWYAMRFLGSIYQWFLCNSNIPGTTTIGRGLRLPHPQNIIVAGFADIGEFCTIYHNVSIAWNGFKRVKPLSPQIGSQVLLGTGAIILGDISIGSDVLVGAGVVVTRSVPEHSRITSARAEIDSRQPTENAAEPGSARHLKDPYSLWR